MIRSKRALLRRFQAADLANLVRLESDPEVMKHTGIGMAITESETQERLQKLIDQGDSMPLGIWAAESIDTHEFIGWFMLKPIDGTDPELGFMLTPEKQNQGYCTEISKTLIDYGFSLGFQSIVASASPENLASIHVLGKIGMHFKRDYSVFNRRLNRSVPLKEFEIIRPH